MSGTREMGGARFVACALLLLCPLALSRHDEDFAFDNSEEFQVELTANHSEIAKNGLKRLWGVPDTSAYVGHLFRMEIPKQAFTGDVLAYKVHSENGRRTPSWLAVDSRHGLISGVPQREDLGAHTFTVTAHGRTRGLTATDSFTIEVKKAEDKPHSKYGSCVGSENRLVLAILIDGSFQNISPRQRIRALMELASFMALDWDEFWIEPYKAEAARKQAVLMSGVGSAPRRHGDATTAIYLNVGCGEKLWSRHKVLVAGLREQARDGTLAHLLRLPVLGWRLAAVKPVPRLKRQSPQDLDDGSGAYDNYDDEEDAQDYSGEYDGDDENYRDVDGDGPEMVDSAPPSPSPGPAPPPPPPPHPHRHRHGESSATDTDTFQTAPAAAPTHAPLPALLTAAPSSTPAPSTPEPPPPATAASPPPATATEGTTRAEDTTTVEPASTNTYTTELEPKVKITPYGGETASEANIVSYSAIPVEIPRGLDHDHVVIIPEDTPTTTEAETQTVIIRASNEPSSPAPTASSPPASSSPASPPPASPPPASPPPASTPPAPAAPPAPAPAPTTSSTTTTTTTEAPLPPPPAPTTSSTTEASETEATEVTQQESVTPSERSSTIIGQTTETVPFAMPVPTRKPPSLKHHMKKVATAAGKAFRYVIPPNLFTDPEDDSNLTYSMYMKEGTKLSRTSWIQFLPSKLEVYALPLEAQVSRWNFVIEAQDSEGRSAQGPLDITVQQLKAGRTINHQFVMHFKLNRTYTYDLDWQIRALEGIVNLLATDMHHITVLNVSQSGDRCEFVWTNDTLFNYSRDSCPTEEIKMLMQIMETSPESHVPSQRLVDVMSPDLVMLDVAWRGAGRCAAAPPTRAPDTYPPVTRNQVDMLRATVGHLLLYKVPEDTFFDPEDGGTRNLQLSLRYMERGELPRDHWLQFDARNQEFYGLPAASDEGTMHYQLIAEDSSKKSAYDSLIVEVLRAPPIKPTVEFQMTLDTDYEQVAHSAASKRKLVEKLAALFGDKDAGNIRVRNITDHPTARTNIIWYNTSLPMDSCPKDKIETLRKMIIADEGTAGNGALKDVVDTVFDKEKVMSITLIPLGLCGEQGTKTLKPQQAAPGARVPRPGAGAGAGAAAEAGYTEYLVTFVIPAVVIVCMLLVAGIIACVLYRRRRTGKMSVGDEEERQAFRSKGIPVIFQDELEERADAEPVHKSPVIMREEKPPLLPPAPDYRQDSAPYRPPPPFAAARTPPRPKATPTYRKPPPYVPP